MTDPDLPASLPPAEPRGRRGGRILAFFIGVTILLVGGMAAFYYFIGKPAMSPVDRLAEALRNVTDNEVTVSGSSVTLARAEMRELAVVERKVQSMVKYETKWLGSDKMLIVKGDFLIKAGFDLTEFDGFELDGSKVVGDWPAAKVLSVEQLDYEIFFSKSGVVNKLSKEDFQQVTNLLQKQARVDAEENSDILESAERVIQRRLEDLSGGTYEWNPK
ncbi:DUF4230 domain-containing protein [Akkermansiaceae bacterium]|nr:DUF4230 domain-containing protein [Akkermansiaceae bacterium]